MKRLSALLLLAALGLSCQRDAVNGEQEFILDRTIGNQLSERYQLVRDTVNGVETRRVRRVRGNVNLLKLVNNDRVTVAIPAADVVLRGDSVRLGILRITDYDPDFAKRSCEGAPDYLIITHYGKDSTLLSLDQGNIQPITKRTVFRVGRHNYLLRSVDFGGRRVSVLPLENARSEQTTAAFDLRYRSVSVKRLEGGETTLDHRRGHPMAICFTDFVHLKQGNLRSLDRAYREQTGAAGSWDVYLINHSHSPGTLAREVARQGLQLPVLKSTPTTCRNLNCRPTLPYCVEVDPAGRVVSYYTPVESIVRQLR